MSRHIRSKWSTSRTDRRKSAERCQEARAKRSPEQQLELVKLRPGNSAKETTRLLSAIEERDRPKPVKKKGPSGRRKGKKGKQNVKS